MKRALLWIVATLALLAIAGWTVAEGAPHRFEFLGDAQPASTRRGASVDVPGLARCDNGITELAIYRLPQAPDDLITDVRSELRAEAGWREDATIQPTAIWFIQEQGPTRRAVVVSRREAAVTMISVRPESCVEKLRRWLGR